jgi:hypothetical protein
MEITSRVIKQGEVIGVRLNDAGLSYPVVLQALSSKEVFFPLKDSGWRLVGLPFVFSKQGTRMSELPAEDFESLPRNERADFYSFNREDLLTEEEMAAELPDDKEYMPWRAPLYVLIHTRQQLLDFLGSYEKLQFASSIPESYCPLNSFCAPEALFTPEEYFDPRNMQYVSVIEKRRDMAFEVYQEVVSLFLSLGMPNSFTALDFQKFYFSWGLCGVNSGLISEKDGVNSSYIFGQQFSSDYSGYDYPRITKDIFLDSEGNAIPPLEAGWKLPETRPDLKLIGENEIVRVTAFKEVGDKIYTMTCDGFRATFSDYRMRYDNLVTGRTRWLSPAQVRYPLSYDVLPVTHYNINSDSSRQAIKNQLIVRALSQELVKSLQVNSDSSSLKALMASGFTERAALYYIASRMSKLTVTSGNEDGGSIDNEAVIRLTTIRDNLADYLSGAEDIDMEMRVSTDIFDDGAQASIADVEDFVNDARVGNVNIDAILDGQNSDASAAKDTYKVVFSALLNNNLITPMNLINQVKNFSLGEDENAGFMDIVTDTGSFVRVPVSKGDLQILSFAYDLRNYRTQMADEAMAWIYVARVYRETTTNGNPRHVGVKLYRFDHANVGRNSLSLQNTDIIFALNDLIMDLIQNLQNAVLRRKAEYNINQFIAYAIFEAYSKQTLSVKMPSQLDGQILYLSAELLKKINSRMYVKYDSTFAISDTMSIGDNLQYFCSNATIMPDFVLPNDGVLLHTYDFLANWQDLSRDPFKLKSLRERRIVPYADEEPDFTGLCNVYRRDYAIDHSDCEEFKKMKAAGGFMRDDEATQISPWSLRKYAESVKSEIKARVESKTQQISYLPMLHEVAYPLSYPMHEPELCTAEEFNTNVAPAANEFFIRNVLLAKNESLKNMMTVNRFAKEDYETKGFINITALPSVLFGIPESETIIDLPHRLSDKKIKLAIHIGDALMFADNTKVLAKDLDSLDPLVYSYEKLRGYMFIMDIDGRVLARKIS